MIQLGCFIGWNHKRHMVGDLLKLELENVRVLHWVNIWWLLHVRLSSVLSGKAPVRHWLDTLRYWNYLRFFLSGHMQDTITIGVKLEHTELSELNVFIGWTLTCIWPQRFKRFALVSPSDLKKCSFVWHLKRFGVLLGGTCETLRQVGPCWLDTCKSFGPNGLYWFHSFYITSRIVFSHSIRCTTETHGIWLLNTHLFTFMNMWQLL